MFETLAQLSAEAARQEPAPTPVSAAFKPAAPAASASPAAAASGASARAAQAAAAPPGKDIFSGQAARGGEGDGDAGADDGDMDVVGALPPPRSRGVGVRLKFTARAFPTPLRESRKKEEDDWLARNYFKLQEQKKEAGAGFRAPFTEKDREWRRGGGVAGWRVGGVRGATHRLTPRPPRTPCPSQRRG